MQDLDLYTGKPGPLYSNQAPRFEAPDVEYFSRMSDHINLNERKTKKNATRIISVISGLCIIAFTAGLVIGIKFTGGKDKQLVDPQMKRIISDMAGQGAHTADAPVVESSVPAAAQSASATVASAYPKAEFPYVVRLGNEMAKEKADEAASYLSGKGHTVILSKNGQSYRLYSGPFRTAESAEISLQKIRSYGDSRFSHTQVIKR